ncbi:acyl-CoA desaturase [Bradyrhizobium sp. GCM10027634]|uniref:acyl-CoA desaturase n=1 Tax=unclassified Bradyrhizobium TaxID=2631580 RepID=UPI00188CDE91|nr:MULTISPECIES: acyl-CoA desaturase [unclassified Bradyrhizobium]MDN5001926.1 acyl-CoA desaturase [Bradyrhizobium sp. WYCCWR 12677]QOZ45789.1 acyl-CoA desaturase [Bradyrhizobium sp. CCBAU 53340]
MTVIEGVAPEQGAERTLPPKMPPGVLFEGEVVDAKFRDSYISFALMIGGTIGALIWAFAYGIGRVEIAVFAGMFMLTTMGIGFMHRYFVHRSYRCGPVMRTILAAIATMAVQGSILKWVSNHRRHHLHSDRPGDVHSPYYDGFGNPIEGFAKGMGHAQGGWVWDKATTDAEYYARDILADPIAMFFTRTRWYWYALSALIIPAALGYAFGGVRTMIGCVLFSGLFRSYLMTMATSLVNSVCHSDGRWGYRRFDTGDGTTNELVTTILTFGEGLHNNHHRFPRDAYLSHAWYEVDINGLIILGLGKLGLVTDIFMAGSKAAASRDADGGKPSTPDTEAAA